MNTDNLFNDCIESGKYILDLLNSKNAVPNKRNIRNIYKLLTVAILENENDPKYDEVKALVASIREKWVDNFSDNIDALNSNNNNSNSNNNSMNNNVNSRVNNFNANTANFEGNNMGNANLGENNVNSNSNNNSTNMNNSVSGGRRRNKRKTKKCCKTYRNKVSRRSRLKNTCSRRR
jgi:ATP-dependent Lon protease